MLIAEKILTAQQHLELRLRHSFFEKTESFPRILTEKTHAGVKGGAAPAFERPVSDIVKYRACGKHIFDSHSGCGLRLVRIT